MTNTHNDATVLSIPQRLLGEATRLAEGLQPVLDDVAKLWPDVEALLQNAAASASERRTFALFQQIRQKHVDIAAQVMKLSPEANVILARYNRACMPDVLREIKSSLTHVDSDKLADEELLAHCKRSLDVLEAGPSQWAFFVASAQIPLYSLVYFHCDVLSAFLDRPTTLHRTLDAAVVLLKEAAKDVAGEFIPFFGVLEAVLDLSKPQFEREDALLRTTAQQLDRLFKLDDSLSRLCDHSNFTDAAIRLSDKSTRAAEQMFRREAEWLLGTLNAARRDSP